MCLISLSTKDITSASTSIVQSGFCYSLPDLFVKASVDQGPHEFSLGKNIDFSKTGQNRIF